jgi:hypothetical protein
MNSVFILWHCHELVRGNDEKLIGVYRTREEAAEAVGRLENKPGFRDTPKGFAIHEYVLGRDGWTEGYLSETEAIADLPGKRRTARTDGLSVRGLGFCCDQMRRAVSSAEIPVDYEPKFREFGVRVLDGGTSVIQLKYCPWSGHRLPDSLRDRWFDELERRGIDPYGNDIPSEYSDERWYVNKAE